MERKQPTSTDMFVESLRRLPAVDAAANAMWSSNALLRDDGARRRKERKWELRWLWVFPQLPVETDEGLAQAILVYKSADVRDTSIQLGLSSALTDMLTAHAGRCAAACSPRVLSTRGGTSQI